MPRKPTECRHNIVRVMDFTPLGVLVGCTQCDETFVIPDENVEKHFTNFTHVSRQGPQHDYTVLIHDSLL